MCCFSTELYNILLHTYCMAYFMIKLWIVLLDLSACFNESCRFHAHVKVIVILSLENKLQSALVGAAAALVVALVAGILS